VKKKQKKQKRCKNCVRLKFQSYIFENQVKCEPRKELLPLTTIEMDEPIMMVIPSHVEVKRCSGSCDGSGTIPAFHIHWSLTSSF